MNVVACSLQGVKVGKRSTSRTYVLTYLMAGKS